MEAWMAAAGLVTVAAITPGPNNLIVMRAAARAGMRGALPAMAGVVLGGLALLGVVVVGGGVLFEVIPQLRTAITLGGCLYLAWSAVLMVAKTFRPLDPAGEVEDARAPGGAAAVFAFQFLNPKSWIMVLTAVSVVPSDGPVAAFARLAPLFVVIPAVGLTVWSYLGRLVALVMRRPAARSWFDRAMGSLLLVSAGLLLLGA